MDDEPIEKVRQAIMRYRELLEQLKVRLANAERAYEALFKDVSEEQRSSLPHKALQREAAVIALEDLTPLRNAALRMQFDMRDLEHGFEELYNNIAPEE